MAAASAKAALTSATEGLPLTTAVKSVMEPAGNGTRSDMPSSRPFMEASTRLVARAGAVNIVPSSTGAARATSLVLAAMKGRLDGMSLRVPLPVGSITDFTAVVQGNPSVAEVNAAFAEAAAKPPLDRVLDYTEDPLVSSDIVGQSASCIFDAGLTIVQSINSEMSLVKVEGWYDNEWGYSNRLVDLTVLVGS